jgi:hypothetical protein
MIFHDEEGVHMSEADYAELVKREIGPCGKHRDADWVEDLKDDICRLTNKGYCKICREIEQAVAGAKRQ